MIRVDVNIALEEKAETKNEALNLPVELHSFTRLWPQTLGSDWKNKSMDTSSQNLFPVQSV